MRIEGQECLPCSESARLEAIQAGVEHIRREINGDGVARIGMVDRIRKNDARIEEIRAQVSAHDRFIRGNGKAGFDRRLEQFGDLIDRIDERMSRLERESVERHEALLARIQAEESTRVEAVIAVRRERDMAESESGSIGRRFRSGW